MTIVWVDPSTSTVGNWYFKMLCLSGDLVNGHCLCGNTTINFQSEKISPTTSRSIYYLSSSWLWTSCWWLWWWCWWCWSAQQSPALLLRLWSECAQFVHLGQQPARQPLVPWYLQLLWRATAMSRYQAQLVFTHQRMRSLRTVLTILGLRWRIFSN